VDFYPLLMVPAFDPRPWGTLDLTQIYSNYRFQEKIGESWLTGDKCKVANGPLAGKPLAELCTRFGAAITGESAADPRQFPCFLNFFFQKKNFRYRFTQTTTLRE
jgi:mannose-6-phosphate isomerase class I